MELVNYYSEVNVHGLKGSRNVEVLTLIDYLLVQDVITSFSFLSFFLSFFCFFYPRMCICMRTDARRILGCKVQDYADRRELQFFWTSVVSLMLVISGDCVK
jgi:hypothetical protein